MIQNVIFDVGGVLMDFPIREVAAIYGENPADTELLYREVFDHPDWVGMDRGGDWRDALRTMETRLPPRLWNRAERAMAEWDTHLTPIPEVNALAAELRRQGYALYILSNTSKRFERFSARIPALGLMDGVMLSFEERLLKPDPALFRRLCDKFDLCPQTCFFIDDNPLNIEAARWCGLEVQLFRRDMGALRGALRQAGVRLEENEAGHEPAEPERRTL